MNVLWITNTMFPAPSKALGLLAPVVEGWTYGLGMHLAASSEIRLAIATTYSGNELKTYDVDGITYYLLPTKSQAVYQVSLEPAWQKITGEFKPDVVHIQGTEFAHGLACMRSCPELKYVVSIQGMVDVYTRYYLAGMSTKDILRNITFRDLIRRDTIFQAKTKFKKRSVNEREYIQRTDHAIGRTSWDYAHVKSMNSAVNYHFCNESLRKEFYKAEKWDISQKRNHSIFLSQAYYPIKGAHQLFKAAAMLKKDFPEMQIRIAGSSVCKDETLMDKIRLSGFSKYLMSLLKKFDLNENVRFLGPLGPEQMIEEYQNAHIFVCPSSIENSPNSVGESQLLGAPCIAAYVGGIADMITHGQTGLLYRFEEVEMLAESIRRVFADDNLAQTLSSGGIEAAAQRHDARVNLEQTINIYEKIKANEHH